MTERMDIAPNLQRVLTLRVAIGPGVMLGDSDRQRSASRWLGRRSSSAPAIANWPNDTGRAYRSPFGATHVVIDTPGGLQGRLAQERRRGHLVQNVRLGHARGHVRARHAGGRNA